MFWAFVPDYGIIEEEQFLRPFFELVSCKPILFNSGFEGEWERRRGAEEPGKKRGCYTVRGGNKVWLPLLFSAERNFWRAILCASCCWADVSCITVTPASVAEHWFLYRELRRNKKKKSQYSIRQKKKKALVEELQQSQHPVDLSMSMLVCMCVCVLSEGQIFHGFSLKA